MSPRKFIVVAVGVFALFSVNAMAGKCEGGSCTGGGSRVNNELVSRYAVNPQKLPDFEQVEKYLKMFEERVPEFGAKLRAIANPPESDLEGVIWYKVPEKIRQLEPEVTGLHFSAQQAAMQEGKRIFVSEIDLEKGGAEAARQNGELYLHEILEMALPSKDAATIDRLEIFLRRNDFAPPQATLQDTLRRLGFGDFRTKIAMDAEKETIRAKKEALAKKITERNNARLAKFYDSILENCSRKINFLNLTRSELYDLELFESQQYSKPKDYADVRALETKFRDGLVKKEHFASLMANLYLRVDSNVLESRRYPLSKEAELQLTKQQKNVPPELTKWENMFYINISNEWHKGVQERVCRDVKALKEAGNVGISEVISEKAEGVNSGGAE